MRRFTVFTFLYLAAGMCLNLIAFGKHNLTPMLERVLLGNAGMFYLFAALSISRFWQQILLNIRMRLREQPTWIQKLSAISPWLIIAVTLCSFILAVLTNQRTTDVISQAVSGLTLILLCIEWLFTRQQIQS